MKQFSKTPLLSLLLLLIFSRTSARFLPSDQVDSPVLMKLNEITLQEDDPFSSLMGLEKSCGDRDDEEEECDKRRMVGEAHLDYIYTQHLKP